MKRTIPAAEEAERGLVASAFLHLGHTIQEAQTRGITAEMFFFEQYGNIWRVLADHHAQGKSCDLILATRALKDVGKLQSVGGVGKLTELATELPTAQYAGQYADVVKEKFALREIIRHSGELLEGAYRGEKPGELMEQTQRALLELVRLGHGIQKHARSMTELASDAVMRLQEAVEGKTQWKLKSGIPALDAVIGGLASPEVIFICAKSSDGKSALALNMVEHNAVHNGMRVGIISMEMTDQQTVDRLMASTGRVDTRAIKLRGQIQEHELTRIGAAASKIAAAKIYIRDDGQLTMSEIAATLSAWKAKHGLDLAVIDHIQLVRGEGKTSGRTEEMESISRALKPLAKRLDVPLLVLSQVTDKDGELRTKNSQALTEDADKILVISHSEDGSWIHVSKNRDGERDKSIPVAFLRNIQRFEERTMEEPRQKVTGKRRF